MEENGRRKVSVPHYANQLMGVFGKETVGEAAAVYNGAGKKLKVFTLAEESAEHCQADSSNMPVDDIGGLGCGSPLGEAPRGFSGDDSGRQPRSIKHK